MFYSQYVLTKKGPLAKIWLAAHMQSKLTKAMVFATDVRKAVDKIISPEAPMALRLTSNLLLGVARILSRKARYLLQESNEAMTKMKLTFRKGAASNLDLPDSENNANYNAITLDAGPEDINAPLLDLDMLPRPGRRSVDRTHSSSPRAFLAAERDITIDEFATGGMAGSMNDAFALDPEMLRERDSLEQEPLMFTPSQRTPLRSASPAVASVLSMPRSTGSLGSVEALRAGTPRSSDQPATPRLDLPTPRLDTPAAGVRNLDSPEIARAATAEAVLGTPKLTGADVDLPEVDPIPPPVDDEPMPPPPADEDVIMADQPAEADASRFSLDDAQLELPVGEDAEARLSLGGDLVLEDAPETSQAADASQAADVSQAADTSQADVSHGVDSQVGDTQSVVQDPREATSQAQSQTQVEEQQVEQQVTDPRQRGRKRRALTHMDDEKTEMTATEFRACLNDTSDLLRRKRVKRRTPSSAATMRNPEAELATPAAGMPAQMGALFAQWFADDPLQRVSSPLSETGADKDKTAEDVEETRDRQPSPTPLPSSADADDVSQAASGQTMSRRSGSAGFAPSPGVVSPVQPEFLPPQIEMMEPEPAVPPAPEEDPIPPPTEDDPIPPLPVDEPQPPTEDVAPEPRLASPEAEEPMVTAGEGTLREVAFTRVEMDSSTDEDRLTKRALKMRSVISEQLQDGKFNLNAMLKAEKSTRKVAARTFYEALNLCSHRLVRLEQQTPFGDVLVAPLQPAFDNAQTSS